MAERELQIPQRGCIPKPRVPRSGTLGCEFHRAAERCRRSIPLADLTITVTDPWNARSLLEWNAFSVLAPHGGIPASECSRFAVLPERYYLKGTGGGSFPAQGIRISPIPFFSLPSTTLARQYDF